MSKEDQRLNQATGGLVVMSDGEFGIDIHLFVNGFNLCLSVRSFVWEYL